MLEKFLKLPSKSILYSKSVIETINHHLDLEDKIEFVPIEEIPVINDVDLVLVVEQDSNVLFDNYKKEFNLEKDKLLILWKLKTDFKLKFQTIKLSNYNKLSEEVNPKIRNYVFEVVDYFKRNNITNFDGNITFVFNKDKLFVYSLEVRENE